MTVAFAAAAVLVKSADTFVVKVDGESDKVPEEASDIVLAIGSVFVISTIEKSLIIAPPVVVAIARSSLGQPCAYFIKYIIANY
jgi:hypothetical protein